MITPVFKDCKNGQYKIISFYAKKARGLMARYLIEQQSSDVEQLKQFKAEGYYFSDAESSGDTLVFLRDELVIAAAFFGDLEEPFLPFVVAEADRVDSGFVVRED